MFPSKASVQSESQPPPFKPICSLGPPNYEQPFLVVYPGILSLEIYEPKPQVFVLSLSANTLRNEIYSLFHILKNMGLRPLILKTTIRGMVMDTLRETIISSTAHFKVNRVRNDALLVCK